MSDINYVDLSRTGWHETSDYGPAVDLQHDFYEVDYLPENDRIRYTISPDARKEILKRLLKLNHAIHEQEVQQVQSKKKSVGSWHKMSAYWQYAPLVLD